MKRVREWSCPERGKRDRERERERERELFKSVM
jgi:hypothetical protein